MLFSVQIIVHRCASLAMQHLLTVDLLRRLLSKCVSGTSSGTSRGSRDHSASLSFSTQLCANLAGPVGAAVLRCSATDGLSTLSKLFISLELIYIDADLHYGRVKETLVDALRLFPRALIAGGGWELSRGIQRAVQVGSRATFFSDAACPKAPRASEQVAPPFCRRLQLKMILRCTLSKGARGRCTAGSSVRPVG